ncbi:MAG: large-conductance mechanosensitive channel protein MscL [Muribaculaceae bacterium]|nr:large-conductance mechanosensitive channel protein MscL [Muribaculaceae bacterium]
MGFVKEFKEFAMRGNVMDMAVGVIIGGAFGKIVTSLVDDVLMPLISKLTGGLDFAEGLALKLGEGENAAILKYGNFIQNIIDFLIIAFCIFLMIKAMNKLMPKKEEPEEPAGPTQEELLTDIRDLLKEKK